MVNVGNPDNLIVNSNWILKQGTDQYILKNTLTLDISRNRFRDAIDTGPVNTFGAGDHSVPCTFEADITKSVNWVNLNARDQLTGFLPNMPYTLTMQSKNFTGVGSGASVSISISNGQIISANITSGGSGYTSIFLSLSGGSSTRAGKIVGIISEGILVKVIIIDKGEGYSSSPTVTETEVNSPLAFEFNAEVGDVSISPSDTEGRVKIDVTLFITDDTIHPVDV